jgi:hypothetical protein
MVFYKLKTQKNIKDVTRIKELLFVYFVYFNSNYKKSKAVEKKYLKVFLLFKS